MAHGEARHQAGTLAAQLRAEAEDSGEAPWEVFMEKFQEESSTQWNMYIMPSSDL